ncbi:MAG: hypothetical protein ABJ246_09545 [Paracoccaceae bacterium]
MMFAVLLAVMYLIGSFLHGIIPEWVRQLIAFLPDGLESFVLAAVPFMGLMASFFYWHWAEEAILANGKLSGPPLGRIAAALSLFVFKKAYERNFVQVIEDARQEYYEALAESAKLKAYIVLFSAHFILVATAVALLGSFLADTFVKTWKSLK